MGTLDGTKWAPSDGKPNPTIQGWLRDIGTAYPNMAAYCNSVVSSSYFSWCGLTVAYCMAKNNIAPVFGATEVTQFLFAAAWLGWGTPVTTSPQPGDVLVFDFGGGDHHVTLFAKDNGDGTYGCHGGNQSHAVDVTNFPEKCLMGIRRPSLTAQQPVVVAGSLAPGAQGRVVAALQSALATQGLDPGGIDGEFGPLTSAAISNFQRARKLPVTGSADPATLQALRVSTDTGPQPTVAAQEPTMQLPDILKTVIDALITKQQGTTPALTLTTTPAQGQVDITQVLQLAIAALAGKPLPAQTATGIGSSTTTGSAIGTSAQPVLSIIDQIFGGQALAGKKTMLAVIAYVILAILQATGVAGTATGDTATPTGDILTTLIGAFGALGGLAKLDRLTQTLGQVANQAAPPQK
jgi:peptidoglycan hydrolase-like protein with peptidoglycan-binding domain